MQNTVKLKPFVQKDIIRAFSMYEMALRPVIEDSFGWDDEFQRNRFNTKYELNSFRWVEINSERIGYICYWKNLSQIHISLLIIDSEKRNLGYGHLVMEFLHAKAKSQHYKVTLSSFKKNQGAIRFYEKIGYTIVGDDEHFVEMILNVR